MNETIAHAVRYRLSDAGGQMLDYGEGASSIRQEVGALEGVTPVADLDAAIKGYVDGRGAGGPTTGWEGSWGTSTQGFGWMSCNPFGVGFANVAPAARGICRVTPVIVGARAISIDAMAVNVNTAQALTTVRLGIYSLNTTTLAPTALLATAGTADTTTTGVKIVTFAATLSIPANSVFIGVGVMLEGAALGALLLNGSPSSADFALLGKSDIDANETPSWANAVAVSDGYLPVYTALTSIVNLPSSGWFRRSA